MKYANIREVRKRTLNYIVRKLPTAEQLKGGEWTANFMVGTIQQVEIESLVKSLGFTSIFQAIAMGLGKQIAKLMADDDWEKIPAIVEKAKKGGLDGNKADKLLETIRDWYKA